MTTLLLVRHGETDWNAEGKLQGHTDRPLNDYGRRQAQILADRLAKEKIDAVYASDLCRARETAEILGERLGLAVGVDPDLREKNWGSWEGLTSDERLHVAYEGETSAIEALHLEYQKLVIQHPDMACRLASFPTAIFSGRKRAEKVPIGIFFCYRLPALDTERDSFTLEVGPTRWLFTPVDSNDTVLEDTAEIAAYIRYRHVYAIKRHAYGIASGANHILNCPIARSDFRDGAVVGVSYPDIFSIKSHSCRV